MSLAPSLCISVIQWKSKDALSELGHDIYPQESLHVLVLEAEDRVDIWSGAEVIPNGVSSALLVTGGDGTESCIPNVTFFIAALILFFGNWACELLGCAIFTSVNQFASTMA